jgi:hypothetical protein
MTLVFVGSFLHFSMVMIESCFFRQVPVGLQSPIADQGLLLSNKLSAV